jgi:dihydroorotate dehydrogenase electron transfer subunit
MMKAVAGLAKKAEVFCEVSLENLMACGFGVCLCCIEPTVKGNLRVCIDGPVFNINELKWQI